MTLNKIMLEAIFGACCNEATAPSHITRFVSDNFKQLKLIQPEDVELFERKVKDTITRLKQTRMLAVEYYCDGEFHVIATDNFADSLGYDFKEVQTC